MYQHRPGRPGDRAFSVENAISAFFDSHYGQVYFFYGLAFFALGLALWLISLVLLYYGKRTFHRTELIARL